MQFALPESIRRRWRSYSLAPASVDVPSAVPALLRAADWLQKEPSRFFRTQCPSERRTPRALRAGGALTDTAIPTSDVPVSFVRTAFRLQPGEALTNVDPARRHPVRDAS